MKSANEQTRSAIRTVLKVIGGFLVAKGVDSSIVELITGIITAAAGVFWSYKEHGGKTPSVLGLLALGCLSLSSLGPLSVGCSTLSDSSATTTLVRIGVRTAAFELARQNPDVVDDAIRLADFLSKVDAVTSPAGLRALALEELEGVHPVHKQSLLDLLDLALAQYGDVYAEHLDQLGRSQLLEIVNAIGDSIRLAVQPSVDGPASFVVQGGSVKVVVD